MLPPAIAPSPITALATSTLLRYRATGHRRSQIRLGHLSFIETLLDLFCVHRVPSKSLPTLVGRWVTSQSEISGQSRYTAMNRVLDWDDRHRYGLLPESWIGSVAW